MVKEIFWAVIEGVVTTFVEGVTAFRRAIKAIEQVAFAGLCLMKWLKVEAMTFQSLEKNSFMK